MSPLSPTQLKLFESEGFIVLPNVVNGSDVRKLRFSLSSVIQDACRKQGATADHDSVVPPSDGAAFQFEHDATGHVKSPLKVHKIQGVALVSDDVKDLLRAEVLTAAVIQLTGEDEIDAFGTKFFPVEHGSSGSVGWHDDNYYFGTCRSRTISCVTYLRDTNRQNGCLRVVPGSHKAERVGPERASMYVKDAERHGEFIPEETLLSSTTVGPVDVEVSEGSAVLFDANLLHATWPNTASDGFSERIAFHYIPASVDSEFRGVSFARGKFADRHEATPLTKPNQTKLSAGE